MHISFLHEGLLDGELKMVIQLYISTHDEHIIANESALLEIQVLF